MALQKTKDMIKKLPEHKRHLDFLAALLTIPVLITVILLNLGNLKNNKTTPSPTPTPIAAVKSAPIITITEVTPTPASTALSATPTACIQGIGPLDIAFPEENQTVTNNPVCISIDYQPGNYCAVVWQYSINGSNWSDFSNNSVCLYNLANGANTFTLHAKSLVNNADSTVVRHFTYAGQPTITASPTPIASSSATTQ